MKKILLFAGLVVFAMGCRAQIGQQPVTLNQPYIFNKWISVGPYTTAQMPTAANCKRCMLYNTDSSNFAFSTGTVWSYLNKGISGGGSSVPRWGQIVDTIQKQHDLMNLFNLKVNYTDTAGMLAAYVRAALAVKYADTANMLANYLRSALGLKYTDSAAMLAPYLRSALFTPAGIGLGNLLNSRQVVNTGGIDSMAKGTFALLPPAASGPTLYYATDSNFFLYNNRTAYVKILGGSGGGGGGDDSTFMLSKHQAVLTYVPLTSYNLAGISAAQGYTSYNATNPSGFINGNQAITLTPSGDIKGKASGSTAITPVDTVIGLLSALLPSLSTGNLRWSGTQWIFDNTHYLIGADTNNISALIALRVKYGDTAAMLSPYLRSATAAATYLTTASISGKLNVSDTAAMLAAYLRAALGVKYTDTAGMLAPYQRAATAMKYADSAAMLAPYLRSATAAATYATITNLALKINISDSAAMLAPYQRSAAAAATYATIVNLALAKLNNDSTALTGYTNRGQNQKTKDSLVALINSHVNVRIGPIDSLASVAQGLQIVNGTILGQTAKISSVNPGMMTQAQALQLDSLYRQLIKSHITLAHAGSGTWAAYTSLLGDSLYSKNDTAGTGLTMSTRADSSRLWAVNFSLVAGLTNTQTLTNKTLTSPILNFGSDATGDIYYRNSSGLTTRLPIGTTGQVVTVVSGVPAWAASAGGGGSQNLALVLNAIYDSIGISGGTGIKIPAATHSNAGVVTAALQARVDSLVTVWNYGHGHNIVRAPFTMDSLIFAGINVTANSGLTATYTGGRDSVAFNIAFTTLTTNGDMLTYNGGPTRVAAGTTGQIWTMLGTGLPGWATTSGTGTVTTFSITPTVGTLFTTSVANASTTPATTISLTAAPANGVWGSVAGGVPAYFNPSLTSSLFANEGTAVTVLHGNASGNPTWGAVNMATDVTGTMGAAQFPALGGDVSVVAGTLTTAIGAGKVTNTMLAGAIDLTSKVTGLLPGTFGGDGVNNGSTTFTRAGNVTFAGAFPFVGTLTASTTLTFPTSGTLLTTTGSGTGLTGIIGTLTGTANEVIVTNTSGTNYTLSGPQALGTANSPTFTGLTLTGLPTGAGTDGILTQSGSTVRTISTATLAASVAALTGGSFTSWQQILTGGSQNVTSNYIAIVPITNISSMTLNLPTSPFDGQTITVYAGGSSSINTPGSSVVGSFTLNPGGTNTLLMSSTPTNFLAGQVLRVQYNAALEQWYGNKN